MTRVSICYDGTDVVDGGGRCKLRIARTRAGFALLAVMEKLSGEEVFNLIRYGVIGIVFGGCRLVLVS